MEHIKGNQVSPHTGMQELGAPKRNFFQFRYFVVLMLFFTYALLNIQIISTSVSIVAMINNSAIQSHMQSNNGSVACTMNIANTTQDTHPMPQGEFSWTPEIQGYILGAGNFGNYVAHFPGGLLAQTIGGKITILFGLFLASVSHFVSPFAARGGSYFMMGVQLLRGAGLGILPAGIFVLAANWTPRIERGAIMSFIFTGVSVGSIVGGVSSGAMCDSAIFGGWPSVYYIFGILGLILGISYVFFINESPSQSNRISDVERRYIVDNQEMDLTKKRPPTPWREILTSAPFYAQTAAAFGNFWANSHFLSVHPTFLGTILHFTIEENGLFSSVPFALQTVFTLIGSWISNWLIRNNFVGLNKVRKGFNLLSCLGYSISIFGIYFSGCDKTLSTVFSILAAGFIGFMNAGGVINPMDLSPNFAGNLVGLGSWVALSPTYIVPVVVGNLTKHEQSLEQWHKMFFISIAVVMSTGIIFCVFGSAEVQPWNFSPEERKNKSENISDQIIYAYNSTDCHMDSTSHL